MRVEITNDDRALWAWLDEHVHGWLVAPDERCLAKSQESWEAYVKEVKEFALSCKDVHEWDAKFLNTVKPLYWPANRRPLKWGPIPPRSR